MHLHHLGMSRSCAMTCSQLRLVHLRLHEHGQRVAERGGVQAPVVALQSACPASSAARRAWTVFRESPSFCATETIVARGFSVIASRDATVGVIDDVHSARSYGTVARIVEHSALVCGE